MKKLLLLFLLVSMSGLSYAVVSPTWADRFAGDPAVEGVNPALLHTAMDQFINLTPAQVEQLTGEKLTLTQTVTLKAAQKVVKKRMNKDQEIPKGLYIVLAILGWAWLAMGIMDNWEGSNWWVNLILSWVLCWIPGVIHAFIKMKDYY